MTYKKDKSNKISMRLTDAQLSKLDSLCNSRKKSQADIIRDIFDYYFLQFDIRGIDND